MNATDLHKYFPLVLDLSNESCVESSLRMFVSSFKATLEIICSQVLPCG